MNYIKTVGKFDIYFEALPEDIPVSDLFSEQEDIDEAVEKIESGEWVYFCAHVVAKVNDIELGDDYLGGCIYESEEGFYETKDGYFDNMASQAINEAKETLQELTAA